MFCYFKTLTLLIHADVPGACAAARLAAGKYAIFHKAAAQTVAPFSFYAALAMVQEAALAHRTQVNDTEVFVPAMAKIELLAREGQQIYGGMPYLLRAELAALKGQRRSTEALYMRAVDMLAESGYPAYHAAALERAGRYFARHGNHTLARAFLGQACDVNALWGARVKTEMLEAEFPHYVTRRGHVGLGTSTHASNASTRTGLTQSLELPALLQATQALAGEVQLDRLVAKIMENMLHAAGASRAVLLLEEQGRLRVMADSGDAGEWPRELVLSVQRMGEQRLP